MNITVNFELEIEGNCSEDLIREKFIEWFPPSPKVSPQEFDDDFQVWVRSWEVV
jgi:hypothetical protein